MEKNRSTWARLLSVVLALVVMACLAVTAFAETVIDPTELENVLNGTQDPAEGVDYDVDGNGIVEWDDLNALNGTQVDLLPNGHTDWLGIEDNASLMQSLVVRGDSTRALALSADNDLAELVFEGDFSGYAGITVDALWPQNAGEVTFTLWATDAWYEIPVTLTATTEGWSTLLVDFMDIEASLPDDAPENALADIVGLDIEWDGTNEVYIDNLQLVEGNVTYEAGANGVTGLTGKYVIAGQPYGTLPTPVRPFYTFAGWYADAEYENAVTADTIVAAGDSYTLYAKWEAAESGVLMSEGGVNAILSVVEGEEDTYLYSVETPSSYEDRYLNIDIQDVTAPVVSIDFKFVSVTDESGTEVTPAMYLSDRQDAGVFGAYYVIVDKATGEPVTTLATGTEYTAYVTLKAGYHKSIKMIPMGNANNGYKYSVAVSAPVYHEDAPNMGVYMVPSSGNHAMMSWYKTAEGGWQYAYVANNDLPLLAYTAGNTYAQNTSYLRRIALGAGAATTEVRFDFQYKTAKNGADTLVSFGLNNGGTVTIQNANGETVANPVEGEWYTAVVTKDGASMGTGFDVYTLGNDIDGSDTNDVQVELLIKNLRAKKAVSADDGSATISGALVNDDKTNLTVLSNGADTKEFTVKLANTGYKQLRFQMKLDAAPSNFALAYSFSDSTEGYYDNPIVVIMDENHKAVKAADVEAGQWYTVVIYGTNDMYNNGSYNVQYSAVVPASGTVSITSDANVQIRELEALSGQFGYRMYGAEIGWTRVDLSAHGYSTGYDMSQTGTTEWASRTEIAAQGGQYSAMTYDFYIYEAGTEAPNFTGTWKPVFTIRGTDTEVAYADLQAGVWYSAYVDMSSWGTGTYYQYVGNYATSQFKAYMANLCYVPADKMFDNINSTISLDNDGDSTTTGTTSFSATGMTVTLEKNGADGDFWADRIRRDDMRGTYRVSGTSAAWSDRALKLSLLDSTKELVQVDVRFLVSKDADGMPVAPTLNVYGNTSGTPESVPYIIVDEDDNPVTELVTGNWYRIFITTQGKSNFAIVPAIEGDVELQLDNLATYNTDELNVTLAADAAQMSVMLSRFGDLQYAYTNTASANEVTIQAAIAASKQIRFKFVLRELGTPVMNVSDAQIVIKDADGNAVDAANLAVDTWYTAVITKSGNALGSSLTMNVGSGSIRMVIKDLVSYITTDEPAAETQNDIFHGLNSDEMMIAGFIGPRDEYYRGYINMPSMVRDDIFKLIADAGINYVTDNGQDYRNNGVHASQEILRLAAKYGINYFMKATDVATVGDVTSTNEEVISNTTYTHQNYYSSIASYTAFAAKLAEMAQYDSFGGLFLRDEPSSDLFDYIAQAKEHVVQYNSENGTNLNMFANLLPGVGWYRWSNGSETHANWQAYIQDFISTTNIGYTFFDMYPIQGDAGNIEDAYIEYMGHIAYTAAQNNVPWMGCVQVGGGQPSYGSTKREPTEGEMHWNVNSLLAFGAKGLDYYILVSPPYFGDDADMNAETIDNHALITINGDTTAYYDYVSGINKHVKAIDHVLMTSTHKGVIFTGTQLTSYDYSDSDGVSTTLLDTTAELSSVKLNSITAAHAMTGAFDYNGETALLVVNNSLTEADTVTLYLTGTYYAEVIQDAKTTLNAASNTVTLSLPIGRSALVILHTSEVSIDGTVAFDVNYAGATSSYDNKTVSVGKTYGELPTPERTGYNFEGWFLYADGSGDEITADTVVSVTGAHVLYAKWTLPADTNPVVVQDNAEYNPNNAIMTRSIVDGKNVYTYTTRGVNNPTTSAWGRRVNINFTAGAQTHVAVEFRYTEAYHADGTTAFAPSLGVYCNNEGNGGSYISTIDIYDSNGVRVTGSNATDGLTVGEWYTLVVGVKEVTGSFELRTAHNYTTDAAILTMEIRDRSTYTSNDIVPSTVEGFARPGLIWTEADGWHYFIPNNGDDTVSAWSRRTQIALPEDGMVQLIYEAKINNVSGNATNRIRVSTGKNEYYDLETGELLSTSESTFYLEVGKWYKIVHTSNDLQNMGTSGYTFCYPGDSSNTGNLSLSFRNFSAKGAPEYLVSFDLNGAEGTAPDPITVTGGSAYGELTTPVWAGYEFGGWYTTAACTGTAVSSTTTVTGTHTLYAKWILPEDTNPVTITARDANNLSVSRSIVDGKNIYTMTTVGVNSSGTEAWQWAAMATAPDNTHTHMAVTFKFNFAYAADGVTAIDPTMTVWRGTAAGSGVDMRIYETDTGTQVDSGNQKAALELDKWYTVVITNPSGALQTTYRLTPCYSYAGAAQFSIDIADRGLYDNSADAATLSTPWGVMPDPALSMVDGEVMYVIWAKDANQAAYYRSFRAVMKQDKMGELSFEYKMSNVNGGAVVGITGMKTYDLTTGELATELVADTWYKAVYSTGANLGTGNLELGYLGGDSSTAGGFDMYIRNIRAIAIGAVTVSFDGNYDGAETFDSVTIEQGAAYGTLPTPADREGYTFGGWYTDAACSGTAVTAETTVSAAHTLYAKWEIVPDTNTVVVGSVTNGTKTVDYVDGKHVYTYATSGATGSLSRKVNISFPEGQTHVAVEFCITESFTSDGVTELAPYLRVYDQADGGNGGTYINTIWIYDADGELVASNNAQTSLTVGQWYTLIVKMNTGTNFYMCPLSHYTTDAPVLTMKIRDRGAYAAPGTLTTAWDAMPDPVLHFVDGEFQYDIIGNAATATGEQRQMNLTLSTDGMTHVMYEVMVENPTGGASAKISNGNTTFYDLETGMKVTTFEEGKWYGATYTTGSNLGTSQLNIGYLGSDSSTAGGIDVHVRKLRAYAADSNTAAATATETYWGTLYRTDESTYRWTTTNATSNGSEAALYQRAINFTNPLTTAAVIKVDFKFLYCTDSSGNAVTPNMFAFDGSTISAQQSEFVVVDPDTGAVVSELQLGKVYSIYVMADASATVSLKVCCGASAGLRAAVEILSSEALTYDAPAVTMAPNATYYGNMGLYKDGDEWVYGYAHSTGIHTASTDYRKIQVYLDASTYTTLQFKCKYQESTSNGEHISAVNLSTGTLTITDSEGNTVDKGSLVADTWYTWTITAATDSTLPTNMQIYTMGWSIAGSADAPIHIKMVIKDLQVS